MRRSRQHRKLESIVRDTISHHHLLEEGDRVIVALSGGADSVALLSVLLDLGYDCMAAHCNFHLRGSESMRDMHHAQSVCAKLGVNLAVRDFNVDAHRAATGESIEMACRTLRYNWFDTLLTREHCRAVAVGHHREDQIETVLLNLFRGTGITGLTGMRYRRDYIIRPMLDASREDIEAYLDSKDLDYITDSSNLSDAHLRNRIRNRIMPLIKDLFPGASNAILTTVSNLNDTRRIYEDKINDYRRRYVLPDGSVNVAMLAVEIPDLAANILRELIKTTGLSFSQCNDIIASATASGLHFDAGGVTVAELDRGILSFFRPEALHSADIYSVDLRRDLLSPVNLRISRHHISEFSPGQDSAILYLDETALSKKHIWQLRRPRKGDRIKPFGMTGSKLLSDLYTDAKYSAADKRNAWVLTCDDRIVWALGLRASAYFPVTPDTRHYLKIIYKPLNTI